MMHEPNDGTLVPDNVRTLLDKLSSDELIAVGRYFLQERGVDPYAYLDEIDDDLDEEERAALDASIERGLQQMKEGKGRDAQEVLAELRKR